MKHELVKWLCIDVTLVWFMGSNLGESKLNSLFALWLPLLSIVRGVIFKENREY